MARVETSWVARPSSESGDWAFEPLPPPDGELQWELAVQLNRLQARVAERYGIDYGDQTAVFRAITHHFEAAEMVAPPGCGRFLALYLLGLEPLITQLNVDAAMHKAFEKAFQRLQGES